MDSRYASTIKNIHVQTFPKMTWQMIFLNDQYDEMAIRKIWRQDFQVYQSLGPTIAALTLGSTDPQAPPLSQSTSTTITTTKYRHNHYQ